MNTWHQQKRQETFVFPRYHLKLLLWQIEKIQPLPQTTHTDTAQRNIYKIKNTLQFSNVNK